MTTDQDGSELGTAAANLIETDRPGGRKRTRDGVKLYRVEPFTRFVVARQFAGQRVHLTINAIRRNHISTVITGELIAVARGQAGLQSDVVVIMLGDETVRAYSIATVERIAEV